MTADENGIRFSGEKGHAWTWTYDDIQELRLEPEKIHILTYKGSRLRLGADLEFEFRGNLPVNDLYQLWRSRMDQRFVAQLAEPSAVEFTLPVKLLQRFRGSHGTLAFGADLVVYSSPGDSRTWRYSDIDNISSSGPFQLTITTFERARADYGNRKGFNFELKEPITEARYNQIWFQIEKKNGRIQ